MSPSKDLQALQKKFHTWLETTFAGSGNPEVHDAWEACDFLKHNFPDDKLNDLKTVFTSVQARLDKLDTQWLYHRKPQTTMMPALNAKVLSTEELSLNPWQLSFDPAHSVKGKSKMVNVLRCVSDFLERPYDSMENPIHVIQTSKAETIEDFSLGHGIGFAKSLAVKLLLLATVALELSDAEVVLILPQLKACFFFRCTYKTSGSRRADRFQVLQDKFGESARSRPDPIQVARLLLDQATEDGLNWVTACNSLIHEFNGGSRNEDRKLTDLEASIVRIFPLLDQDTRELIDYHWQNYKVKQSALPYTVLSVDVFLQGTKPKKGQESDLWSSILSADNRKRHWYTMRKIHFFVARLADARRLRKKVNLTTMSNQFRSTEDLVMAWCMACVFSHFLPEWQKMLADAEMVALTDRFGRGNFDAELQEKVRAMNPNLQATSFRFLADLGVKVRFLENFSYICHC